MLSLNLLTLFGLLPVLSAAYVLLTAIYNVTLHPLAKYPGPKLWSAFRLPYVIHLQRGMIHQQLREFHDRYGSVVRIAPDELSFVDPRAWKDIYGTRPGHAIFERNKSWFRKMTPTEPDSIMGPDEANHKRFRASLVHAFSQQALKEQAPIAESYVDVLVAQLRKRTQTGEVVNLVDWLNYTTFDISGDFSFGESFECLERGVQHPWVDISYGFGKGLAMIASINNYPPFATLLKHVIPKNLLEKRRIFEETSRDKVQRRLAARDLKERFGYLRTIQEQSSIKGEYGMNLDEMVLNMSILVFAGAETTATALSGIMRCLLQNPNEMAVLAAAIRATFAKESEITTATVGSLPMLDAVIHEGLRLCPPVVIGVPRVVPSGGDTVCGQWVPGGTLVAVNQYPAYMSSENFEEPQRFIPSRFLAEASDSGQDNKLAFQPFGIGRHACVGQSLAMAEMRLIIARTIYAFDISLANENDVWEWGNQKTFIFWEKESLKVHLKEAERTLQ